MMDGWSEYEREEFWRMLRELGRDVGMAMRNDIAGFKERPSELIEAFRSHENIELAGRFYGTLISKANARELEAIRIDAMTASDLADAAHDVALVLLARVAAVLGKVFVTVDPPHTPAGAETMRREPVEALMHAYTLAFVRRPTVESSQHDGEP